MKYIDVSWQHSNPEDPVRLVSEVDDEGWEARKLEFFLGGVVGYASATARTTRTRLGDAPVPHLTEINSQGEFDGKEIGATEFEALWKEHVGNAT